MIATERIVQTPQRIDFHIHSAESTKTRDADKEALKKCDKSKIPLLVKRLTAEDTGVTMCAITDHDIFSYEMYDALKAHEGEGTLASVLPGVEFTVSIENSRPGGKQTDPTVIHIVAIFDDVDEKLRTLNDHIVGADGKPDYDADNAFSADKFTKIIREIGLDSVLIGHEKSAGQEGTHDISSLGIEGAKGAILTEFVDAVELRSKHKEINIKRLMATYPHGGVPFVFGTDCHDWASYPLMNSSFKGREDEVAFSSVKCLPSFRGLVMAITDQSRIKAGDCSFFSAASAKLEELILTVKGKPIEIPLSPGINAIIGDNSIGKSLLTHKMTEYREIQGKKYKSLREGYDSYCESEGLEVVTKLPKPRTFRFDDQRKVRKTFEDLHAGQDVDDYFRQYFRQCVSVEYYQTVLKNHFKRCLASLERKVMFNEYLNTLAEVTVEVGEEHRMTSLSIDIKATRESVAEVAEVIGKVQTEIEIITQIADDHERVIAAMDPRAKDSLTNAITQLQSFLQHARQLKSDRELANMKLDAISNAAKSVRTLLNSAKSDEQRRAEARREEFAQISNDIATAVLMGAACDNRSLDPDIEKIREETTDMGSFIFVSELSEPVLDAGFCRGIIETVFNKQAAQDVIAGVEGATSMTVGDIVKGMSYEKPQESACFKVALDKINDQIEELLYEKKRITNADIGIDREPSAGLYSRIYFDLIAEAETPGVYIIDQPEDQISQTSIKTHVLKAFKKMSERRQVLLVTHNPQFVVNLDVDNVIALSRDEESGEIIVQSGALEYKCNDYNMLDVVAETVEGGADVVRKRLKRYGSDED